MDEAQIFEDHYEFIENLAPLSQNLPALEQFLNSAIHPYIRKKAIHKIAQIPNFKSEKILRKALTDENPVVKQAAISALYELEHSKATSNEMSVMLQRYAQITWDYEFKKINSTHASIIKKSIIDVLKT